MANIQKQLVAFHEAIKLNNLDENANLREKRDVLLEKLRANLAKDFADRGAKAPTFQFRNQGSYAMSTGVKPVEDDYDIDVALFFNLRASDHNPVDVKKWVETALRGHKVQMREPCVTVWYQRQGEAIYHVDFAVYSAPEMSPDGKARLARGFPGSAATRKIWEPAEPLRLVDLVNDRFQGTDRDQFRRVVRYLKRWSDVRFSSRGEGAPVGIGLTIAAYHGFQASRGYGYVADYDDLAAIRKLVEWMLARFQRQWTLQGSPERLVVQKPVVPSDNPFDRMSDLQMSKFKQKLIELRDACSDAERQPDAARAIAALQPHFGPSLKA